MQRFTPWIERTLVVCMVLVAVLMGTLLFPTQKTSASAPVFNYPAPSLAAFNWSGTSVSLAVTSVTGNVAFNTNGASSPIATTAVVQNTGATLAYVNMGTTNAVTASTSTGYAVQPNSTVVLAIGANKYIAGITASSTTTLSIATGR